jgi:hypothetical protein
MLQSKSNTHHSISFLMKKSVLSLVAGLLGTSGALADTYVIYNTSTSGTRTNSFSPTILRIKPEQASQKVTYTRYLVRNLAPSGAPTAPKETYVESLVVNGRKSFYVNQTTPQIYSTVRYSPSPIGERVDAISGSTNEKMQFVLSRSTASTTAEYLDDSRRPYRDRNRLFELRRDSAFPPALGAADLTINNQFALFGNIRDVTVPGANTTLTGTTAVAPSLTGSGLNCEIHALRDEAGNFRDYQSNEIICTRFSEKWNLNLGLTAQANSGNPVSVGNATLNPNTDPYAVYVVVNQLLAKGYEQLLPLSQ